MPGPEPAGKQAQSQQEVSGGLSFVFATITQRHTLIQPELIQPECDQE
jgi:hypothetical protein